MPNLKDLKIRISSVKSTQKITQAMKLVSAAKLRRARERAEAAAPYAAKLQELLTSLAGAVSDPDTAPTLLAGNGKDERHLLVMVSSDRGLCGALNSNLLKKVKATIKKLEKENKQVLVYAVGKKAKEQILHLNKNYLFDSEENISKKKKIPYADALMIAEKIITLFEEDKFDVCTLFFSEFKSALMQEPKAQTIIPLPKEAEHNSQNEEENSEDSLEDEASIIYEYEPSEKVILEELLPKNISVQVYNALLENVASEHGARMTAMDNATRNAGEMIKNLTLQYNRTRQAVITSELIEIISGAEAL